MKKRYNMRIGIGYDVHKFAPSRELIIGGVRIPHDCGLLGHSDADVLLHALADALLGAAALGDIGVHFPPSDPRYAGADSLVLLAKAWDMVKAAGYGFGNADCVIIAETPKMSPHTARMRENIARVLETSVANVSVKATTEEGLGLAGAGIGAKAAVLLV